MAREELLKIAKPILFNTETVQEILEGRKTVTRRVIKNAEIEINNNYVYIHELNRQGERIDNVNCGFPYSDKKITEFMNINYAPYQIGDILYVRETFCEVPYEYEHIPMKNGHITVPKIAYRADSEIDYTGIWKPSIHMPKELARIFLKATDVRVERLQDITEEQAIKEGVGNLFIEHIAYSGDKKYNTPSKHETLAMEQFELLWNSTIKKQDLNRYGWDANPWVWVIEFERVEEDLKW